MSGRAGEPAIDFSEFKVRINAIKIAPDLLGEVMVMLAGLPAAERGDFEARATRIVGFLDGKHIGDNSVLLALAIAVRLMALDSVMDDRLVKEWLIPAPDQGVTYVHADLLRVAVEEPVTEDSEGRPAFVVGSFCRCLARAAAARGCA